MADPTCELTVLAAALQEPRYFALATASGIKDSSFNTEAYARVWGALAEAGWEQKIDMAALLTRLKGRGVSDPNTLVRQLAEANSYAWGSEAVGGAIKEMTSVRQGEDLKAILADLKALRADTTVDLLSQVATVQGRLSALAGQLSQANGNAHNTSAYEAVTGLLDELAVAPIGTRPGLQSRFEGINSLLGGYEAGTYTVFAGRTSVGKSTLLCWEALKLTEGGTVVYFSLEMSARQLATKLLSMLTGITTDAIRHRKLTLDQRQRLWEAGNHPCFKRIKIIDAMRVKPSYIRAVLARESGELEQHGQRISAVVIDHLLLMNSDAPRQGTRERVMECSAAMKAMAKEFYVPFLVLTQLKRDVEKDGEIRRPSLVDLKESSSLEEDADTVVLLHGDREKEELVLIMAKNREGQLGEVPLKFHKTAQTFTEARSQSPFGANEALRQLQALEPVWEGAFHKDGADQLRFLDEYFVEAAGRVAVGQHTEGVLEGHRVVVTLHRSPGEEAWVKQYYCYCPGFQHDPDKKACKHVRQAHKLRNAAAESGQFRVLERPKAPAAEIDVKPQTSYVTTAAPVAAAS